jgi:hypothetical protein
MSLFAIIDLWKPERLSELHDDVETNSVTMMKSRSKKGDGCAQERERETIDLGETRLHSHSNVEGREHMEDRGVDGRILKVTGWECVQ